MPRSKKRDASSDSGSASDSDSGSGSDKGKKPEKPAPKKAKTSSGGSSSRVEDEKEPTWQLDKMRFLKVREFKGRIFVDIREFYDSNGDLKPGKKGISLSVAQFNKLKEAIPEVEDAIKNM